MICLQISFLQELLIVGMEM